MANYVCNGANSCSCQGNMTQNNCVCSSNEGSVGGVSDETVTSCSCPNRCFSGCCDTVLGIPNKEFLVLVSMFLLLLTLFGEDL